MVQWLETLQARTEGKGTISPGMVQFSSSGTLVMVLVTDNKILSGSLIWRRHSSQGYLITESTMEGRDVAQSGTRSHSKAKLCLGDDYLEKSTRIITAAARGAATDSWLHVSGLSHRSRSPLSDAVAHETLLVSGNRKRHDSHFSPCFVLILGSSNIKYLVFCQQNVIPRSQITIGSEKEQMLSHLSLYKEEVIAGPCLFRNTRLDKWEQMVLELKQITRKGPDLGLGHTGWPGLKTAKDYGHYLS